MASMAVSFSNFISLLLLSTLVMSLTIHARDSQFFSKVTHVTIPATTNNNVVKETELPRKEVPVNKPEQEPSFMPETESSYGLYGHESYKTEPEQHTDKYPNKYYTYNNDAYNTNQKEFTNTKLTGTEYSNDNNNNNNNNNNYNYNNNYKTDAYGRSQNEFNSMENHNNNYNQKYEYNNNNNAGNDRYFDNNKNDKYFYDKYASKNTYYTNNNNAANNKYNVERQGMSDTRFMENGKYFYDLESEKHDQSLYGVSSKGVNSRNWENNRGYFGNNNVKSYENNNSFEGYQNQEEFEEEPENFEP